VFVFFYFYATVARGYLIIEATPNIRVGSVFSSLSSKQHHFCRRTKGGNRYGI
jgi:hypothetical protein